MDEQQDIWVLSSGVEATVQMPDLYGILSTVGAVPSQIMVDVMNLLDQEGVVLPGLDPAHKFLRIRNNIIGMYALASLILISPRLVLPQRRNGQMVMPPLADGEIGPRDLTINDVEALYYRYFRGGYRPPPRSAAPAAGPDGAAEPASDLPGILADAEPVSAD